MQNKLFKYYIGFAVLGLFTFGLLIFVVIQASAAKSDAQTYKAAQKTAESINKYIDQEQMIPNSLDGAKITYNKETITYKKISDEKYTFCVTYNTNGASVDGTSLIGEVLYGSSTVYDSDETDTYEYPEIYLSSIHSKGENCQTVKPYVAGGGVELQYDDYGGSSLYDDQSEATDAAYKQMDAKLTECNQNTSLSDEAYDDCVDEAYDLYYTAD